MKCKQSLCLIYFYDVQLKKIEFYMMGCETEFTGKVFDFAFSKGEGNVAA